MTGPVDFYGGMKTVVVDECVGVVVELGPTPTLVKMGRRCVETPSDLVWVSSMEVPKTKSSRAAADSSFGAAVTAVLDSDAHRFVAARLPWHSNTLIHPILQRITQDEDSLVALNTGMRGPHVIGSTNHCTMASLSQHVISGSILMPAAAMIDAAVAAVRHTDRSRTLRSQQNAKSPGLAVVLQGVLLERPLPLTEEGGCVRTCVGLDGLGTTIIEQLDMV
jgi:hypothetical protein